MKCYVPWGRNISLNEGRLTMAKPRSVDLSNPFLDNLEGVCELLLVRHGEQQYK